METDNQTLPPDYTARLAVMAEILQTQPLRAETAAEMVEKLQAVQVVLLSGNPAGLRQGAEAVGVDGYNDAGGNAKHVGPLRAIGDAHAPDAVLHAADFPAGHD